MSTFGPDYDEEIDGPRIAKQHERIRDYMLGDGEWRTLAEMESALKYPQASISAQLRHLRKERFGGFEVDKRRRVEDGGTWEYLVRTKEPQTELEFETKRARPRRPPAKTRTDIFEVSWW